MTALKKRAVPIAMMEPAMAVGSAPCCARAVHEELVADPTSFTALPLVGYQEVAARATTPVDVLELRGCAFCHSPLARSIGTPIHDRLTRARREDNISMIERCRRALGGEAAAIAALHAEGVL